MLIVTIEFQCLLCTVLLTSDFLGRLCQTFPKYSMVLPYVGLVYNTSSELSLIPFSLIHRTLHLTQLLQAESIQSTFH